MLFAAHASKGCLGTLSVICVIYAVSGHLLEATVIFLDVAYAVLAEIRGAAEVKAR